MYLAKTFSALCSQSTCTLWNCSSIAGGQKQVLPNNSILQLKRFTSERNCRSVCSDSSRNRCSVVCNDSIDIIYRQDCVSQLKRLVCLQSRSLGHNVR